MTSTDTISPRGRDLISIVSPVYNEQDNLELFYKTVTDVVRDADFDLEMILVNDGSQDRSEEVLERLAKQDSRVTVLSFSRNFGAVAACNAGLRIAKGDAVVLLATDLQDPPGLIPRLVTEWRNGNDIVWAVRETRDDPASKVLFARLFYVAIRLFVFPDYPENGTDCGLVSRRVLDIYNLIPERDSNPFFTIYSFGFRQARIPYNRMARKRGKSHWSFLRRLKNCIDIITAFSYLPIRIISATGAIFSIFALLYGLLIIIRRVLFGLGGDGWTSLAVLLLFVGGMLSLFVGIIAEYVWRIAEHSRQRPRYIIARRYGGSPSLQGLYDTLHIEVSQPSITSVARERPSSPTAE